ncbi:DUF1450 domain-containing protein [Cytobacillus oceanisediminis]|uniref:DUF1450 domain-containing protein n=1 Tax=Cytobacillus oceanisediminis TaxID=665099 RepID=UPI00215B4AB0|nr:DUF1450 domain-containing protein [Cytobacillus oceanisediminis]
MVDTASEEALFIINRGSEKNRRMFYQVKLINKLFSKQKPVNIEFCQRNLDEFLKEENFYDYNLFLNQKNINCKEYECQSKCKECKQTPYAVVDGDFIAADNPVELLAKLKVRAEK